MDDIELHERFDALTRLLDERASDPPYQYFFHEESGTEYSEGESFCLNCIREILPDVEIGHHYGGGWSFENDGCEICHKCGCLLEYTLTDYGLSQEMEHFKEYPPENLDNPDECYSLARIAHAIHTDGQRLEMLEIMSSIKTDV